MVAGSTIFYETSLPPGDSQAPGAPAAPPAQGMKVSAAPDRSRTPRHPGKPPHPPASGSLPEPSDPPVLPAPPDAQWQGNGYWTRTGSAARDALDFVQRFQTALRTPAVDDACAFASKSLRDAVEHQAALNHRSCEEELVHSQNDIRSTRATLLRSPGRPYAYVSARGIGALVPLVPTAVQRARGEWGTTLAVSKFASGRWEVSSLSYE